MTGESSKLNVTNKEGWQFWIDRGGTFTDLIGVSPNGNQVVRKVLSDQPGKPGDPAVNVIREVLELKGKDPIPKGIIKEVRLGTTVATNALLESSGNPVILITNKGLGDLLLIGDQHRTNLFTLKINRPKFLANLVIEVEGRIDAKGIEVEPLIIDQSFENRFIQCCKNKNNSYAIALLNSYSNPIHEICLKQWLIKKGCQTVICSHEVSPLPRLVARGQTTLVEASISPVLSSYLNQVTAALGTSTSLQIMGSCGGLLPHNSLHAKDTILSGPAGGMVGAIASAHNYGLGEYPLVGFDMGGTSTDVFYASANQTDQWERSSETDIAGQQLLAERLPIHTVAAGGGSIIKIKNAHLKVGPQSAGATPGPACYRRGGPLTITDANLLLGRIQTKTFPSLFGDSGDQPLDVSIVRDKFKDLAEILSSTPEKIAEGAIEIAVEHMSDAIKQVSIFCGHDIRGGVLIAFGGAGGQHACRLATKLGLKTILISPLAGVLSAYGIGMAQKARLTHKSLRKPLNKELIDKIRRLCESEKSAALQELEANGDIHREHQEGGRLRQVTRIEIRYQSCEEGLMIKFDDHSNQQTLMKDFERTHLKRFGYIPPRNQQLIVERLEIEVIGSKPSSRFEKEAITINKNSDLNLTYVHFPSYGWKEIPCYQRDQLMEGDYLKGPALIMESTNSIVLDPEWSATVQAKGGIVINATSAKYKNKDKGPTCNTKKPDPILLELFNHRFSSIAKKMGERLRQTSRSVNIRERLDFSCAIFDMHGELVANAPHIPVHLGAMSESIIDLLKQISAGDRSPLSSHETVVTNDPFHGGTHLPDITAITPVFAGNKEPSYFVACRGHHSDIGGLTPGSMPPFSKTIEDEGLLLRNETFVIDGYFDHSNWEKRLKQCKIPPRNPSELIADLQAQVAANQLGVEEMEKLISMAGEKEVSAYMKYLQANASLAVQNIVKNLKDSYFTVELDNGSKLCVEIKVDKSKNKVKLDFSNTSPQGETNFQAPLAITKAAVLYVFRCLINEDIPLNAGCFEPLELIIPKGCILNPVPPAAVVAGNVETSQALCNLLFGALGVLSASQGTMNNLTFGDDTKQYYETIAGGSGAGNGFNGTDGIQTHMTNSRLTDPEILEQRYPVKLELFSIRKESGGQGKWKGGNGLIRKFRFLEPMTVSILSGSRRVAPFGLDGGMAGAIGCNELEPINGKIKRINGCSTLKVAAGESILIKTPGGGGYGKQMD